MSAYFLVEHADWTDPCRIKVGENSNANDPRLVGFEMARVQTIGSSSQCHLVLPDNSLPEIVAVVAHFRYRRNFVMELPKRLYHQQTELNAKNMESQLFKVFEWKFEVAGYKILGMYPDLTWAPEKAPPLSDEFLLKNREVEIIMNRHMDVYPDNLNELTQELHEKVIAGANGKSTEGIFTKLRNILKR